MIIFLGIFISFFENFDFWGQKWGKGTKMTQNWQNVCRHSVRGLTCDTIVTFSMFVIFSIFSTFLAFFHFSEILILDQKWNKRAIIGQE